MKPYTLLLFLSVAISLQAFTQDSSGIDDKMNRMKVGTLLTHKILDGTVLDAYKLKGGMICIVPDSSIAQRMKIVRPK